MLKNAQENALKDSLLLPMSCRENEEYKARGIRESRNSQTQRRSTRPYRKPKQQLACGLLHFKSSSVMTFFARPPLCENSVLPARNQFGQP